MIKRDALTPVTLVATDDGYGGTTEAETSYSDVRCRVSVSNNVEQATQYGVLTNQLLTVITDVPLDGDKFLFQGKEYALRATVQSRREYINTLSEVV
jgi:hypothetical protein